MAFNPFTSFRKYNKIWMAGILLLCMVTFVLCQGLGQGDLGDRIIGMLTGRSGKEVAKVNGRSIRDRELADLKDYRAIANDYMRRATEQSFLHLKELMKEAGKIKSDKDREKQSKRLTQLMYELDQILKRPNYFETGTKLDDLLDFILWQDQADRLGIELFPGNVQELVDVAVHGQETRFGPWESRVVQNKVRETHYKATDDVLLKALRQEFRVQIAKVSLMGSRPYGPSVPMQVRAPVTPYEVWEYYRKQRTECDVALVPVKVADFVDKVKAPDQGQLETLFEQRRREKYDPTSPAPGFESPQEVKITWVTANPNSDFYRRLAETVLTLQQTSPVVWTPALPGLGEAVRLGAGAAAWQASLERDYENMKNNPRFRDTFRTVALTDPNFALPLYTKIAEPTPATVAAVVGAALQPGPTSAAPAIYQGAAYKSQEEELAPDLQAAINQRWPVGATLLLSAAGPTTLTTAALWETANQQEQFLPLGSVKFGLTEMAQTRLALDWVRQNMQYVKKQLEMDEGNELALNIRLQNLLDQPLGLEVHRTSRFRNRYDIEEEPALQEFRKAFEKYISEINIIEGRSGTERQLKEDDFHKLFFDSGENFAIGNAPRYVLKVWPPTVTSDPRRAMMGIQLPGMPDPSEGVKTIQMWNNAEKPILFWKSDERSSHFPESLDAVKADVARAWKFSKARRELALPRAVEIAKNLKKAQVGGQDYLPLMEKEAAEFGRELITLKSVAPLIAEQFDFNAPRSYKPYQLPRGLIPYPREDMSKDILALNDLKVPLRVESKDLKDLKELDDINKDLFDKDLLNRKPPVKQVQILTNKPQTVFYVAAVIREYEPDRGDFRRAAQFAAGNQMMRDELFDRAQEEAGKEFREHFMQELRRSANLEVVDRSNWDTDSGS